MRLLTVVAAALTVPAWSQNATVFRADPGRTGVYDAAGVPKLGGVRWKFATRGKVISSPAVAGGTVFAGSTDRNLYALDRETGALRWKFETGSAVSSSPAVADGIVYFGSFDGKFYAVEAATGKLRWKFDTGGERRFTHRNLHGLEPAGEAMPDPWDFYLSSPAVASGAVYFGSGNGSIYALDASTGAMKWQVRTGDVVHASPAVSGATVYAGSWDGYLYALDAATGAEKWRFKTGEDPKIGNQVGFQASPAVAGGVVYAGCRDSKFYAVDAKTGRQIWAFPNNGSWVITSAAVEDGLVYFGTSDTGLLRIVDAKTGKQEFSLDLKFPVFASPSIAHGVLYVATLEGKLRAIDLKTREILWVFQTKSSRRNAEFLTDKNGKLDFGKLMTGNFYDDMVVGLEKLFAAGSIASSPAIDGANVYFGSTDGSVYALQ